MWFALRICALGSSLIFGDDVSVGVGDEEARSPKVERRSASGSLMMGYLLIIGYSR